MGFYTTILEPRTAPRKTPSCSSKTASRNFFSYPVKTSYKNRSNYLKTSQENSIYSYKTASGRSSWLSRDPIEEDGGVNLYAFVGNDPIGRWDRLGLCGDNCVELCAEWNASLYALEYLNRTSVMLSLGVMTEVLLEVIGQITPAQRAANVEFLLALMDQITPSLAAMKVANDADVIEVNKVPCTCVTDQETLDIRSDIADLRVLYRQVHRAIEANR